MEWHTYLMPTNASRCNVCSSRLRGLYKRVFFLHPFWNIFFLACYQWTLKTVICIINLAQSQETRALIPKSIWSGIRHQIGTSVLNFPLIRVKLLSCLSHYISQVVFVTAAVLILIWSSKYVHTLNTLLFCWLLITKPILSFPFHSAWYRAVTAK